jgi:hypothetical protein
MMAWHSKQHQFRTSGNAASQTGDRLAGYYDPRSPRLVYLLDLPGSLTASKVANSTL